MGRVRAVVTGVLGSETGYGVGNGDHPHVYREGDVFLGVCFGVGSDDILSEHAQEGNLLVCCNLAM